MAEETNGVETPGNDTLVIALFYAAGKPLTRQNVTKALGKGAEDYAELFGQFSLHPTYRDNREVTASILRLVTGGALVSYTQPKSPYTLKHVQYASTQYNELDQAYKSVIDELASWLNRT